MTRRPGSAIWLTWRDGQRARGAESALSAMRLKFHGDGAVTRDSLPHVLLRSDRLRWAHYRDTQGVTVIENPSAVLHRDRWYLFYSGNRFETNYYSTGIAYCGRTLAAGTCTPIPGPRRAYFAYTGPDIRLPGSLRLRGLPGNERGPGAMDVYRARGGQTWVTWNFLTGQGLDRKSRTGKLLIEGSGENARFRVV